MGKPARDLTGQNFGKLTIVKRIETDKARPHWLCKCDCGNETIAETSILTRKKEPKISCGCMMVQKIDMSGKRFGRLIVKESIKVKGERRHKWKCLCDCGKETLVLRSSLVHGATKSCGCLAIEKFIEFTRNNIGEKHQNFNPNITRTERLRQRKTNEYLNWRTNVFKRDNYKCKICNKDNELNAHHIFGHDSYPELATEVNNGITFCKKCHKLYHHIFGNGSHTREEFREFLCIISKKEYKGMPHKKTKVFLKDSRFDIETISTDRLIETY